MGCCIMKGVTEQCTASLHLTLRLEYGLLYEHIGQLYQGLQWYYLVIGIPLPTEKDIPDT